MSWAKINGGENKGKTEKDSGRVKNVLICPYGLGVSGDAHGDLSQKINCLVAVVPSFYTVTEHVWVYMHVCFIRCFRGAVFLGSISDRIYSTTTVYFESPHQSKTSVCVWIHLWFSPWEKMTSPMSVAGYAASANQPRLALSQANQFRHPCKCAASYCPLPTWFLLAGEQIWSQSCPLIKEGCGWILLIHISNQETPVEGSVWESRSRNKRKKVYERNGERRKEQLEDKESLERKTQRSLLLLLGSRFVFFPWDWVLVKEQCGTWPLKYSGLYHSACMWRNSLWTYSWIFSIFWYYID